MLAQERFERILEILREKQSVTVVELTEKLNTSESTIRRDLTELNRQGLLIKVHGGATVGDHLKRLGTEQVDDLIRRLGPDVRQ